MKILQLLAVVMMLASQASTVFAETSRLETTSHPISDSIEAVRASALWGTIVVSTGNEDEVVVEASIEGELRSEASKDQGPIDGQVWIEVIENAGTLEITPQTELEGFWGIDLRITVPERLAVEVLMERGGEVSVNGVGGSVDIVNWNGSVTASGLRGSALVHARNGSIDVDFESVSAGLPMSFSSLNGSIDVTFPEDVRASIWGRTANADLESDFGAVEKTLDPGDDELSNRAPRRYSGEINGGGPLYSFYSANGSIHLRRRSS